MGLDLTIKRADGRALGEPAFVEGALTQAFPGAVFGWRQSGTERLRAAAEGGTDVPDALREHLETKLAVYGGTCDFQDFLAEFRFCGAELVAEVGVVLYGDTAAADANFDYLERRYGWMITCP